MSYLYGLDPQEADRQLDQLRHEQQSPVPGAGFFDGALEAPVMGVAQGVFLKPSAAIYGAAASIARAFDPDAAKGSIASWIEELHETAVEDVKKAQDRISRYGTAGNIIAGIADTVPQAALGFAAAGPVGAAVAVGGLQGYSDYAVAKTEGVDTITAAEKGAITGATMGVGALLPMSVGTKVIASALFGAGSNVGLGIAQRAATSAVLADAGYNDMAAQYKAVDTQAMVVDAVLGSAFGVVGAKMGKRATPEEVSKPNSEQIAAALTMNEQLHATVDAQPGIHATFESKAAGDAAMSEALDAMEIRGELPDVAAKLGEMDIVPDPSKAEAASIMQDTAKEYFPDKVEPEFELAPWMESDEAVAAREAKTDMQKTPTETYENVYTKMGDDIVNRYPELEVATPDGMRPFADVMAEIKASGNEVQTKAAMYEAAANCILRG